MTNKLMYIPNDDTQNYSFCRFQLLVEKSGLDLTEQTNRNLMKVPKAVEPTNKKTYPITKLYNKQPNLPSVPVELQPYFFNWTQNYDTSLFLRST